MIITYILRAVWGTQVNVRSSLSTMSEPRDSGPESLREQVEGDDRGNGRGQYRGMMGRRANGRFAVVICIMIGVVIEAEPG